MSAPTYSRLALVRHRYGYRYSYRLRIAVRILGARPIWSVCVHIKRTARANRACEFVRAVSESVALDDVSIADGLHATEPYIYVPPYEYPNPPPTSRSVLVSSFSSLAVSHRSFRSPTTLRHQPPPLLPLLLPLLLPPAASSPRTPPLRPVLRWQQQGQPPLPPLLLLLSVLTRMMTAMMMRIILRMTITIDMTTMSTLNPC